MSDRTHLKILAALTCVIALLGGDMDNLFNIALYCLGGLAYIASFFADGSKA